MNESNRLQLAHDLGLLAAELGLVASRLSAKNADDDVSDVEKRLRAAQGRLLSHYNTAYADVLASNSKGSQGVLDALDAISNPEPKK